MESALYFYLRLKLVYRTVIKNNQIGNKDNIIFDTIYIYSLLFLNDNQGHTPNYQLWSINYERRRGKDKQRLKGENEQKKEKKREEDKKTSGFIIS